MSLPMLEPRSAKPRGEALGARRRGIRHSPHCPAATGAVALRVRTASRILPEPLVRIALTTLLLQRTQGESSYRMAGCVRSRR